MMIESRCRSLKKKEKIFQLMAFVCQRISWQQRVESLSKYDEQQRRQVKRKITEVI